MGKRKRAPVTKVPKIDDSLSRTPRVVQLLGLSVLGAVVVIAVSVLFTPPPVDSPQAQALDLAEKADLPTVPAPIEVDSLQNELRQLADSFVTKYPKDSASYHVAAQVYAELKQTQQAEELWKKCIAISPRHMGAAIGLAEIYMATGDDEKALEQLMLFQDQPNKSLEMLLSLGQVRENLGELEEALAVYQTVTQQFPQVGNGWLALGRIQNQMSQFEAAEASLRKAIAIDGPSEPSIFALTTSLVRQRRTAEAAKLREQVPASKQVANEEDAGFQSQYEDALRTIASSIYVSAAIIEEEHGELVEAANHCRRAVEIDPLQLRAYMNLSSVYRKANRFADAVVIQRRLLELQPNNLLNYLNLANVELAVGDLNGAEGTLKKGIEIDRRGTLAQTALARLYIASGRVQQAHELAIQVVENQPVAASYELLASSYTAAGDSENALAATEKAKQLRTDSTAP